MRGAQRGGAQILEYFGSNVDYLLMVIGKLGNHHRDIASLASASTRLHKVISSKVDTIAVRPTEGSLI